jgi:hypothetical protein
MQYELKILFDSEAETFTIEDVRLENNQSERPKDMPTPPEVQNTSQERNYDHLEALNRKLAEKGMPSLSEMDRRRKQALEIARVSTLASGNMLGEYRRKHAKTLAYH